MWVQSCWLFFNPCQTGDVDGSLEAISDALKTYKSKMVKLTVLSSQVGTVTESDIKLAETFHGKKTEIYFLFSELQMFIHTLPMYKSVHNYSGSSKLLQLVLLLLLFLSLSIYHHVIITVTIFTFHLMPTTSNRYQICPSPFQFLKMSITAPHKYLSD